MKTEDVIYLLCLLACIGFGFITKKIKNETNQKIINTAFGIFIVIIVSGFHTLHCLISFLFGAIVLKTVNSNKCHLVGFGVMFGYLVFFRLVGRFGLPNVPGHTNMIQMILTLKVAGVLFEKNASYKKINQRSIEIAQPSKVTEQKLEGNINEEKLVELTDYDIELQDLSVIDLFHYTFNYIGVLTGPYYRYRTYRDYYEMPFRNYAPNVDVTLSKLKYVCLYGFLYLLVNYKFPIDYIFSTEFYENESIFYRIMYIWPCFFIFRMRIYTGLTLSECVCTCAGFGAYPDEANVTNGEGPKGQYQHFKRNPEKLRYNFTTIVNLRAYNCETCFTFREGMKHWNICIQYWLAVNIYKLFPSKKYRTFVTFFVSSFWHGFLPGHYFCIMGVPFYVAIEDIWNNLIRKNSIGTKRKIIDFVFWIFTFFSFSYLTMAFLLMSFEKLWFYYSSIYHFGYILWATLFIVGTILTKQKKASEKRKQIENKTKS